MSLARRQFSKELIQYSLLSIFGTSLLSCKQVSNTSSNDISLKYDQPFKLSLAEWSFHKALQSGRMDHLDFAGKAKGLGFEGIEYVNQFFKDKATDLSYLKNMNDTANEAGVEQLLIMIDGEGSLATLDNKELLQSVDNHKKWVDAAFTLGCHSIRVNCDGKGDQVDVAAAGVEGLSRLSEYAAKQDINIIVENHGGYSSDGSWMSNVIKDVGMDNCGTLPDFGNFCIAREGGAKWGAPCVNEYDKYKGIQELMPFAKAVSAKSFDFDEQGKEKTIDYNRIMKIIKASGYEGYIGIEYEGENLSEEEGIIKTRDLLMATFKEL